MPNEEVKVEKSEQQSFLDELKGNESSVIDILNQPLGEPEKAKEPEVDPEEVEEKLKNRRHKRLEEKLQKEREVNIALNARVAALSEVQKFRRDEPDADLHSVLYGTAAPTDETKAVASRLQSILENYGEKAQQRALEAIRKEQAEQAKAQKAEEEALDNIIENLEEDHNISLTKEQQQGYFKLLEKMSPKDDDGNVLSYADPDAVWDVYSEKLNAPKESRAKSLASRSMTQSGASGNSKLQQTSQEKWLRENGII